MLADFFLKDSWCDLVKLELFSGGFAVKLGQDDCLTFLSVVFDEDTCEIWAHDVVLNDLFKSCYDLLHCDWKSLVREAWCDCLLPIDLGEQDNWNGFLLNVGDRIEEPDFHKIWGINGDVYFKYTGMRPLDYICEQRLFPCLEDSFSFPLGA